jgi:hypothetical protein
MIIIDGVVDIIINLANYAAPWMDVSKHNKEKFARLFCGIRR